MRKLLLALLILPPFFCIAQEEVPALISLDLYEQHDTLGYNIVNSLPYLINEGVHSGKIHLWDSPKKEKDLSGNFLKQLEEANGTKFVYQHFLFLHELWTTSRRATSFRIIGFSFIGEQKSDSSRFNYGYIDMADIEPILKSNYIPVNINGYYHTTYWDALYHRDYDFNLLQLGKKYYTDFEVAAKNKNKYFNPKKKLLTYYDIPKQKFVACLLDKNVASKSPEAQELLNAFNEHYANNKEEFLNDGGAQVTSHLNTKYTVDISRIEFSSIWKKEGKFIKSEPDYLLLFTENALLDTLFMNELDKWKEEVNYKTIAQLIRDNKYDVMITRINDTNINEQDSKRFLEALRVYRWDKISEYVIKK